MIDTQTVIGLIDQASAVMVWVAISPFGAAIAGTYVPVRRRDIRAALVSWDGPEIRAEMTQAGVLLIGG